MPGVGGVQVFGGKYAYNTWWTQEPRQIFGINLLPITPASTMGELADHPHLAARRTLVDVDGALQPAPAPRFSARAGLHRPAVGPRARRASWGHRIIGA